MTRYIKVTDNIFNTEADAVLNPVNCAGIMGGGLARQFKNKFPDMDKSYQKACKNQSLTPGKLHLYTEKDFEPVIINFPTENNPAFGATMEIVEAGLVALEKLLQVSSINSVAVSPLGAGIGGLKWSEVEPLIVSTLSNLPDDITVYLYQPYEPSKE